MRLTHPLRLPKPTDRYRLGNSGLWVSPICIGICGSPETVARAYEAGVNFFFVSADLHWPMYEATRAGIARLVRDNPARRDDLVIGVVSYLDDPLFSALQFNEVIDSVPGLRRVDLLIAGAVSNDQNFSRITALQKARSTRHVGSAAIGASFHKRPYVTVAAHAGLLDVHYIRYNTAHPGAQFDLFPYLPADRSPLLFNFKSMMFAVPEPTFKTLGLGPHAWLPKPTDYYRFVLSNPHVDGILCSPMSPQEVDSLVQALDDRALAPHEQQYMVWLSSLVHGTMASAMGA